MAEVNGDRPRRFGVFGGTFDPPHVGHVAIAREVRLTERLTEVLWIPARRSPHKLNHQLTPSELRWEMVMAAIEGLEGQEISDLELNREGPSYSVDTLRELRSERPGGRPVLILGSDQFENLRRWREAPELGFLTDLCVVARDDVDPERLQPGVDIEWSLSSLPRVKISSSEIRKRRREGRPYQSLVPEGVAKIIEREDLYCV